MATIIAERASLIVEDEREGISLEFPFETFSDAVWYFSLMTPEKTALIDASLGETVTYRQLEARVEGLASKLAYQGVRKGTRVVLVMPRSAALIETMLAASRVGAGCLPYTSPRSLEDALDVARIALKPALFIYLQGHARALKVMREGERWISFEELEASEQAEQVEHNPCGEDVLYFNETSGSMSRPKIVPATHAAILANTRACVEAFNITAEDVHLCTFSSHAHEFFVRALFTGGTTVLLHEAVADKPHAFLDALVKHRVTCLMSNATTYAALVDLSNYRPEKFSLRLAESGGIPTPESLKPRVAAKFNAQLVPVWGSTETSGVALAPQGERGREGSVGKPLPGYSIKLVDRDGNAVPSGKSGELVISGKGVATRYLSEGDDARLQDGAFRTGDRATIDEDGWVFIRGRIANEFKVAGIVVSAEEIEKALLHSEHVNQVAVLPLNHPTYGYVPVALVVPASDDYYSLSRKGERRVITEIIEEAEGRLKEPFLELPAKIKWVRNLPRTPAGKLDRRSLLKVFAEEPPTATKVRLPRLKQIRLAAGALEGMSISRLLLRSPLGLARLIYRLLKGDKAK